MSIKSKFNLHKLWLNFLKIGGVKESELPPIQKQEMKRTFFGACGLLLDLLRQELSKLDEQEGAETLENMRNQILDFWENEEKNGIR
jgi:hypothetical protein